MATTAPAGHDIHDIHQWQGRSEERVDLIAPAPFAGLGATLDRDDPPPAPGDALPPLWHWLYFLPRDRQSDLGPDGHAKRGGFLPPVPLPRRMWAGGRLEWLQPLRIGDTAKRVSTITSVQSKSGRSGELVFVTVRHEISSPAGPCLTEEHDIVYRGEPRPGDASPTPTRAPERSAWQREIVPDDVLLFRYSALTFNGHRIHYDRNYVTSVEGYPGLVVHGPLQATLLVDLVRRNAPGRELRKFEFRALRPAFDGSPLRICGEPVGANEADLWIADSEGFKTMQARATLA